MNKFEQPTAPEQEAFNAYLRDFKLSEEDLQDKRVVDIGCGADAAFVREGVERGFDVIGMNREFDKKRLDDASLKDHLIRGDVEETAIPPYDLGLARNIYAVHRDTNPFDAILNATRSLKLGGELRIFPYFFAEDVKRMHESREELDVITRILNPDQFKVRSQVSGMHQTPDGKNVVREVLIIKRIGTPDGKTLAPSGRETIPDSDRDPSRAG